MTCKICKKEIIGKRKGTQYCGYECRKKAAKKVEAAKPVSKAKFKKLLKKAYYNYQGTHTKGLWV